MSSRRSSSRRAFSSKITDDEINELVLKLQALLSQLNQGNHSTVSTSRILQETCNYIRRLHREADDLSERLTHLLDFMDTTTSVDAETLRSFLQQ